MSAAPRPGSTKGHPFKLTFDDLEVGDSITTDSRTVTRADIAAFAESTGDMFYAHMDEEAAARSPIFNGLVAHGYLVLSLAAGLFVWPDEGPVLANLRHRSAALRQAHLPRRRDPCGAHLQAKDPAQTGAATARGGLGHQGHQPARARSTRPTTCWTMVANSPGVNGAPEASSNG